MKKLLLLALCTVSITAVSGSFNLTDDEMHEVFEYKPKDMEDLDRHNQKICKSLQSRIESLSDEDKRSEERLIYLFIIQSLRAKKCAYQRALNNNRQESTGEDVRAGIITVFNENLAQLGVN